MNLYGMLTNGRHIMKIFILLMAGMLCGCSFAPKFQGVTGSSYHQGVVFGMTALTFDEPKAVKPITSDSVSTTHTYSQGQSETHR